MHAPVRLTALTFAGVNELIPTMEAGEKLVYHVGSLMYDKLRGANFQTINGVAKAAWDAYERGEVTLVQRKIAPLTYEYILIRLQPAKVLGGQDRRDQSTGRAQG